MIRESTAGKFTIDHPRRTLEDFFLNVVDDARKESITTFGATSGGEIASYLSEGDISETGKEKLARLSGLEPEKKEETAEEPVLSEQSQKKLSELEEKTDPVPEAPLAEDESARQQLDEANRKLSDLLGKMK